MFVAVIPMKRVARLNAAMMLSCASGALLLASAANAQVSAPAESAAGIADGPAPSAQEDAGLTEILVTARKQSENLRDVPVSITAVSGQALVQNNIARVTDLVNLVPNFTMSLGAVQPITFIRGFGSGASLSFEQTVGKFVDNVSFGRDFDGRVPLFDLERVEVLKGPQVLLYGNSATAGALNITTRKPGRTFEADGSASYEFNNHEVLLQGGVTTPLNDWASLRVAGMFQDLSRGWIYNAGNGRHEPTIHNWAVRPSLRLSPADGLDVTLKAEVDRIHDEGAVSQPIRQAAAPIRQMPEVTLDDRRDSNYNVAPFFMKEYTTIHAETYQGDISYDVLGGTLNSTTAYRKAHVGTAQGNGSNAPTIIPTLDQRYKQFSQELRFSSDIGDLDYVLGGYYQHDTLHVFSFLPLDLSPYGIALPRLSKLQMFDQRANSYSGFADLTYHLTPEFSIEAGARYSVIRKTSDQSNNGANFVSGINFNTTRAFAIAQLNPALDGAYTAAFGGIPHFFEGIKTREEHFQPQVIVQYKLAPRTMLYAKYVKGNKAGGVDYAYAGSVARGATIADAQFEPEAARSYEVGLKGITDDNRFEYSIAAYSTTFTNLQTGVFLGTSLFTTNVGKARTRGVELELNYALVEGLRLTAAAAVLDAEYLSYPGAACTTSQTAAGTCSPATGGQDLSGAPTPFASKFSGSFGFNYRHSTGNLELATGALVSYRSRYNSSTNNDPLGDQKGYATLDAHAEIKPEDGWWTLGLFGRNLSNVMYKEYSVGTPLVPGAFNTFLSRGRQVGIRFAVQFD